MTLGVVEDETHESLAEWPSQWTQSLGQTDPTLQAVGFPGTCEPATIANGLPQTHLAKKKYELPHPLKVRSGFPITWESRWHDNSYRCHRPPGLVRRLRPCSSYVAHLTNQWLATATHMATNVPLTPCRPPFRTNRPTVLSAASGLIPRADRPPAWSQPPRAALAASLDDISTRNRPSSPTARSRHQRSTVQRLLPTPHARSLPSHEAAPTK